MRDWERRKKKGLPKKYLYTKDTRSITYADFVNLEQRNYEKVLREEIGNMESSGTVDEEWAKLKQNIIIAAKVWVLRPLRRRRNILRIWRGTGFASGERFDAGDSLPTADV